MTHPSDTPQIEHPAAEFQGADDLVKRLRDKSLVIQHPERDRIAERIEGLTEDLEAVKAARDMLGNKWAKAAEELAAIKSGWMEPVATVLLIDHGDDTCELVAQFNSLCNVRDNDQLYTAAQLAKVQAERDALRSKWGTTCEQTDAQIAELSAQIARAREALHGIKGMSQRTTLTMKTLNEINATANQALSTLTTGNAVQTIEARALREAAEYFDDSDYWMYRSEAAVALRKLAEQKEKDGSREDS